MADHTRAEKIGGDSIYFCGHPSRKGNFFKHYVEKHQQTFKTSFIIIVKLYLFTDDSSIAQNRKLVETKR